jgi:DNA-directed RNA polymerase II subunit RPB1
LETKAEVKEIMHVPKQIVAPQSNKPCMGIVQDSLLGIMRMTQREVFLPKELVMNLLMHIDYEIDQPLPVPAIIKPKPLWTGKQIISLIMPTALNKEEGDDFCSKKDTTLVIQRGELFAGFLNGKYVKNSANGLIHIIWKDLGPQACCDFLSEAQYIVNNWLVTTSFTIGV